MRCSTTYNYGHAASFMTDLIKVINSSQYPLAIRKLEKFRFEDSKHIQQRHQENRQPRNTR